MISKDSRRKYLVRLIQMALFVAGVVIIYRGLDYVISDDTSSQTRITFHDFYNEEDIDYLFVGTSHSVAGLNAVALSEKLDRNVFNLSIKSLDFHNAYYVVKEAINTKNIDHIFFEVSFSRFKLEKSDETATYIISDYLQSPINRFEMIVSGFGSEKYINSFLRLRRNLDPVYLPSKNDIVENYEKKQGEEYRNYLGIGEKSLYLGKGQWSEDPARTGRNMRAFNYQSDAFDNFRPEDTTDVAWKYLQKIIKLCKDEGVELTFYIFPYSEVYLSRFEQYDAITNLIYDKAGENNIRVIDLNLVKDEYLKLTLDDFYNADHIKVGASEMIAAFFADYIADPTKDYFLASIDEKYPKMDDVMAIGYNKYFVSDEGESLIKSEVEGTVDRLRLEISAFGYSKMETAARLWAVEQEEGSDIYYNREEIRGRRVDSYITQFVIPYDGYQTSYRVQLLNLQNGEILFDTVTKFEMN